MAKTVIERSTVIARDVEGVFDFVADARNDPKWCPRVRSCEQTHGSGPEVGATYLARHNPTLVRTDDRQLVLTLLEPPQRVQWQQNDRSARFVIDYRLELVPGGTRLTQRDEIEWAIPPFAARFVRYVVPLRIRSQFRRLRLVLEHTAP